MYLHKTDKISFYNAFVVVSMEEKDPPDSEGEVYVPNSEEGPPKKQSCKEEMYVKALTSCYTYTYPLMIFRIHIDSNGSKGHKPEGKGKK